MTIDEHFQIKEKLDRWRKFYDSAKPALMVAVKPIWSGANEAIFYHRSFQLNDFDMLDENQHLQYLDQVAKSHLEYIRHLPNIGDDYIPHVFLYYGQAIFSTFVYDRPVRMIDDTSWTNPCIKNLKDIDQIKLDDNNFWFRLYNRGNVYLQNRLSDKSRITGANDYGPLDLANALRGDSLFTDFYDEPDKLHQLMDLCTQAIIWRGDAKRAITYDVGGGTMSLFMFWTPGKTGVISLDTSIMINPELFEEFELPYIQRIVDHCGGYAFHIHGAWHQYKNYAKIKNIQMLNITSDPNMAKSIDNLGLILDTFGDTPIHLDLKPDEIFQHIDLLKQGRFFITTQSDSEKETLEILELIKNNSRVYN